MPPSLADILRQSTERLRQASIETPENDARSLVCHALSCNRLDLLSNKDRLLAEKEIIAIEKAIDRRAAREPVSRIKNKREFWGLSFALNEDTLDPRPDSETLIETALNLCKTPPRRILDLGTGSGCLLLALLHEFKNATGLGIDQSARAIAQARQNAERISLEPPIPYRHSRESGNPAARIGEPYDEKQKYNISERATFLQSDWFKNVTGTFDLIVSNPPYIPSTAIPTLEPEVKSYDPLAALDGGADGLTPYKVIIPQLKNFLAPNGLALFEIGIGQSADVTALLQENGFPSSVHKDLNGIERCVMALTV